MATKTSEDCSGPREKKKNKGIGTMDKTRPPDKRKLEKSVSAINKAIKEKENNLKRISWIQRPDSEIETLMSELAQNEKQKKENDAEVTRIEDEIKSLGLEVISKKSEASKLIAGVRHKTEEKIDEAVGKVELKLHTRRFSATEERKLRQEIDSLRRSKEPLRAYYKLKGEIEEKRTRQESLRSQRDALYSANGKLREKIGHTKDLIADKKAEFEEKRKGALARKEAMEKEIDDLKQARRDLHEEFREQQLFHSRVAAEEREHQREKEQLQIQSRREERQLHRRTRHDVLSPRMPLYHEEKQTCNALIAYTERLSISHTSSDTPPSPSPLRQQVDQSTSLSAEKPGEFLPRKGVEEEGGAFLIPASSRKKSKRDKRRNTISSLKAGKKLNHNALTLGQFSFIGLIPPLTSADLQPVLAQLQEKLTFYSSKSRTGQLAESEAGDSGVGSVACSEIQDFTDTPLTISQEDIASDAFLSPRRSLTDSCNGGLKPTDVEACTQLLRENSLASNFSRSSSSSVVTHMPSTISMATINRSDE